MLSLIPLTFAAVMILCPLLVALFGGRVHVLLGTTGLLYAIGIGVWWLLSASPELHGLLADAAGATDTPAQPRYLGALLGGSVIPATVFLTLWLLHWLRFHQWGGGFGLTSGLLFWVLHLAALTAIVFPAVELGSQPLQPGFAQYERPELLVTVLGWTRRIARYATLGLFLLPFAAMARNTTNPR